MEKQASHPALVRLIAALRTAGRGAGELGAGATSGLMAMPVGVMEMVRRLPNVARAASGLAQPSAAIPSLAARLGVGTGAAASFASPVLAGMGIEHLRGTRPAERQLDETKRDLLKGGENMTGKKMNKQAILPVLPYSGPDLLQRGAGALGRATSNVRGRDLRKGLLPLIQQVYQNKTGAADMTEQMEKDAILPALVLAALAYKFLPGLKAIRAGAGTAGLAGQFGSKYPDGIAIGPTGKEEKPDQTKESYLKGIREGLKKQGLADEEVDNLARFVESYMDRMEQHLGAN